MEGVRKEIHCCEYAPLGELVIRERTYVFGQGMSESQVAQLKMYSLDESDTALRDGTSDYERFGIGSYEEWYSKKRMPFTLTDKEGILAGFIWFGPKPLGRKSLKHLTSAERANEQHQKEDVWHTVSYRAYNPYRGAGIMKPFCTKAIEAYEILFPEATLWLSVDTENEASFKLAEALGFTRDVVHSIPSEHHYVYTKI
jgi:hypothetical protein